MMNEINDIDDKLFEVLSYLNEGKIDLSSLDHSSLITHAKEVLEEYLETGDHI